MNRLKNIAYFSMVVVLTACVSQNRNHGEISSPVHQWSQQELSILQGFWLGNLEPKSDPSNSVANNTIAVDLGHRLFFDKRLSANGEIACASCHKPELYFTDGKRVAEGVGLTRRNTPSIVASNHQHWFFHDGRADSLWSQAMGPLENEIEHGGNRSQFAHIVYADAALRSRYEKLFGPLPDLSDSKRFPRNAGPVNESSAKLAWQGMNSEDQQAITMVFVNLAKALAAYESSIQIGESRFDRYVKAASNNNIKAMMSYLSNDEASGLRIFISKGMCTLCHNGPLLSDFGFHNIATVPREDKERFDWGRFEGAKQVLKSEFNCRGQYNDATNKDCPELKYIVLEKDHTLASFKTPSLRNVAKTAPYMHDGQHQTLSEVLNHYIKPPKKIIGQSDLRLPIELNDLELKQLELFLLALDNPIHAEPKLLAPPKS